MAFLMFILAIIKLGDPAARQGRQIIMYLAQEKDKLRNSNLHDVSSREVRWEERDLINK